MELGLPPFNLLQAQGTRKRTGVLRKVERESSIDFDFFLSYLTFLILKTLHIIVVYAGRHAYTMYR